MRQSSLISRFFGQLPTRLQERSSSVPSSSQTDLEKLNDSVYEVYSPPLPELELVFFHGMLEDFEDAYYRTWLSGDDSQMWLMWLIDAFPTARILTVAYDASATTKVVYPDMYVKGENLLLDLTETSVGVGQAGCPVVLVGYCVGGLMLKQVCSNAAAWVLRANPEEGKPWKEFFSNLRGMFFFGTSHFSESHYGSMLGYNADTFCARLNNEFSALRAKYGWETAGMGETRATYVKHLRKSTVVVSEAAGRYDLDDFRLVDADHYNVCKPEDKNSNRFQLFVNFLRRTVERSRPARQDFTREPETEGPVQWYDDPITYEKMCDPVKCSDGVTYDRWTILDNGVTTSPFSRTTLKILCDDTSVRSRLFQEFPEQQPIYRVRREMYRGEALQQACANNSLEHKEALEKLHNVLNWLPLDPECQRVFTEIQIQEKLLFAGSSTSGMPTAARPNESKRHEDVIRAMGRNFETQLNTFLVFLGIVVCFLIGIYSASIKADQ